MTTDDQPPYEPDHRLSGTYEAANLIDEGGFEGLCPSFVEITGSTLRYREPTFLGRGGVKEVSRVFDTRCRKWVAIAHLREDRGPEFFDVFVHEAWLTAWLSHPNIIKIYDVGAGEDGRPYFTMDLKPGHSLAGVFSTDPVPPQRDLLVIFLRVCEAVGHAHSRGILHLDLKPDNIQVAPFGEVIVCDWGLAQTIDPPDASESDHEPSWIDDGEDFKGIETLTGQIRGTPGYMAPEQTVPDAPKDCRTDVFALGRILQFLLTGRQPSPGSAPQDLDLVSADRKIPDSLRPVVLKATADSPADRYESVDALTSEISKYLAGYSTGAEHPGFFREAFLFLKRNRTEALISLLAIVAVTVVSVLSVQRLQRQVAATVKARDRATTFEQRSLTLEELYQTEKQQSAESRIALAEELATAGNTLKNIAIFEKPLEAVRRAREVVNAALILDPECESARFERIALNCITLDFKAVLSAPKLPASHEYSDYIALASEFPDFAFSETKRPRIDQLAGFIEQSAKLNPGRGPLMERIVAFDFVARGYRGDYAPVCEALLHYLNHGDDRVSFNHQAKRQELTLISAGGIHLRVPETSGSGSSILRLIPLKSLVLQADGPVDLAELNFLPLETLDVRQCPKAGFSGTLQLPRLKELRVHPLPGGDAKWRSAIRSEAPFRILTDPE